MIPESESFDSSISKWGAGVKVALPDGTSKILTLRGLEVADVKWQQTADACGIDLEDLRKAVARKTINPTKHKKAESVIYARANRQRRHDATRIKGSDAKALREACSVEGAHWIEWVGTKDIAVLDLDWHRSEPPSWRALEAVLLRSGAAPAGYWKSKGGGLHAVFEAQDGFLADELAAACAVGMIDAPAMENCSGVEILSKTAVPGEASSLTWQEQRVEGLLYDWLRSDYDAPDMTAIDEYRGSKGWTSTDAEHDQCPFAPQRKTTPKKRPVYFGAEGVTCLSCKAAGLRSYASWAELVGGKKQTNRVRECARILTCWSHARLVLEKDLGEVMPTEILRPAYYALAKLIHGADDPRIPKLSRSKQGDFVRGVGIWLDPIAYTLVKPQQAYFRAMPSNLYTDDEGKTHIDATAMSRCDNSGSIPGFPAIIPVRGASLWGQYLEYPTDSSAVHVERFTGRGSHPRYIPQEERAPDTWAKFEEAYPGIRRDYLKLLLVARAYGESAAGKVPRILTTGPSGSAKSTTVQLAAAMIGDTAPIIVEGKHFRETMDKAFCDGVGWVVCDEFGKPQHRKKTKPTENNPFSVFLSMEQRSYQARPLYVGPVDVEIRSAVVITGVQTPPGMAYDRQLARRFVHVHLDEEIPRLDRVAPGGDVNLAREYLPEVCDSIWSEVVDEFFVEPYPSWEEAAEALGFVRLVDELDEDEDDAFSARARIKQLFEAVNEGIGSDLPPARWAAPGRLRWGFFDDHPAPSLWREICDGFEGEERFRSERVGEVDLRKLLGVEIHPGNAVWLEARGDHRTLCLRFGIGSRKKPLAVNGEILSK